MKINEKDSIDFICPFDEEETMVNRTREALEEEGFEYSLKRNDFPEFTVICEGEMKEYPMTIGCHLGHILISIPYPYSIPELYKLFIALYISKISAESPFKWDFDYISGVLCMKFIYIVDNPESIKKNALRRWICSMFESISEVYGYIRNVCRGDVAENHIETYCRLLRDSVNAFEFGKDRISLKVNNGDNRVNSSGIKAGIKESANLNIQMVLPFEDVI